MSVPTTNSSINTGITSAATKTDSTQKSSNGIASLGPDAFLNLLTTQLRNQNPLEPVDDAQSIAQLAQFSQLQASTNLADSFAKFQQNFGVVQSASLIGKPVTVANSNAADGSNKTDGTIAGVSVVDGIPSFSLKGSDGKLLTDPDSGATQMFSGSQILSIAG